MVDGNFDAALMAVRRLGEEGLAVVVNSINPHRLEGQQTAAWGSSTTRPRARCAGAAGVGNIRPTGAVPPARTRAGRACADARLQAEGGADRAREPVESPETVATAIRIGNPASWMRGRRDESGGLIKRSPMTRSWKVSG